MPQGCDAQSLDPQLLTLTFPSVNEVSPNRASIASDEILISSGQAGSDESNTAWNHGNFLNKASKDYDLAELDLGLVVEREMDARADQARSAPSQTTYMGEPTEIYSAPQLSMPVGADDDPWNHLRKSSACISNNFRRYQNHQSFNPPCEIPNFATVDPGGDSFCGPYDSTSHHPTSSNSNQDKMPNMALNNRCHPEDLGSALDSSHNFELPGYPSLNVHLETNDLQNDHEISTNTDSSYERALDLGLDENLSYTSYPPNNSRALHPCSNEQSLGMALVGSGQVDEPKNVAIQAGLENATLLKEQQDLDMSTYNNYGTPLQNQFYSMGGQFMRLRETIYNPSCNRNKAQDQSPNADLGPFTSHDCVIQRMSKNPIMAQQHSKPVPIPMSNTHHDAARPNSYPITHGFFPPYPQDIPVTFNDGSIKSMESSRDRSNTSPLETLTSLPMRRKASGSKSVRRSRANSLSIIREDGRNSVALASSLNSMAKGRRKGRLSKPTAEAAAKKRKDGNICIRCKMMKTTCKGNGLPCESCLENLNAKSWRHPCMKAVFIDLVLRETCNIIFQRKVFHPTLDGSRRIAVDFAGSFDVPRLLQALRSTKARFNIRVTHWSNYVYDLNLNKIFKVLSKFQKSSSKTTFNLDDFVRSNSIKASEWLKCKEDVDEELNISGQSVNLIDTPSHNAYALVSTHDPSKSRALNIESTNDRNLIFFAIQLARIVIRSLEIETFTILQRRIFELPKSSMLSTALKSLVDQIAQLLLSLRWRSARWTSMPNSPDGDSIERVQRLTYALYCYFFVARKRLMTSGYDIPYPATVQSRYAETKELFEDLPTDDTEPGFFAWMQEGQQLYLQAIVPQYIAHN